MSAFARIAIKYLHSFDSIRGYVFQSLKNVVHYITVHKLARDIDGSINPKYT